MGHAARANAKRRAAGILPPDPYPHVPKADQERIVVEARRQVKRMTKGRGIGRSERDRMAEELARGALQELEERMVAATRKVQPVAGGLVVPRASLLITPEEARRIGARARQ